MAAPDTDVDSEQAADSSPKKGKGLLTGIVLAAVFGGGGFYAVHSGLILTAEPKATASEMTEDAVAPLPEIAFVPIQPILVNVGGPDGDQFLRFQAQLEVVSGTEEEIKLVMPRIVDVLNGYLRAVHISELRERAALVRLRAQMLRRVQVVTGAGRVRDLLIIEFVLS